MSIAPLVFARRHSYEVDRVSNVTECRTSDPYDEFYFICTIKYISGFHLKQRAIYKFSLRVCECICISACVCVCVVSALRTQRRGCDEEAQKGHRAPAEQFSSK